MQKLGLNIGKVAIMVAIYCIHTQLFAAGPMKVKSCSTTSNFKTIQKDCIIVRRKVMPVKKCKTFGEDNTRHCHWVSEPQMIRVGKTRQRTRNPYVTHALRP